MTTDEEPHSLLLAISVVVFILAVWFCLIAISAGAFGKDDGRYANSPFKNWFDSLSSDKGMCCSFADGRTVTDAEWEMADNHYRVRVDGIWYDVPPEALVTVPNVFGQAVVWPYDQNGKVQIRCFMPGAGT